MADNIDLNAGAGGEKVKTDFDGTAHHQYVKMEFGADNTQTPIEDVDTKRLPVKIGEALPAGTNNIGDVDIASLPALPAGSNNIGDVDVLSLPALPAGSNNIGDVDVLSLPSLPAGGNNIGDVDVLTLPALPTGGNTIGNVGIVTAIPAGNNNIGDVDIASALPAGNNNIGDVDIASALPAGTNNIGDVDVLTLPALPAGTNNIGDVDLASSIPAGTNNIGDVDVLTVPADPFGVNADAAVAAGAAGSIQAKLRLVTSQLDAIKTAVEIIDNFISGAKGLVTEDNSAAIKTSVELLDDAIIADNAGFTDGATKLDMGGFIYDEVAGTALTENDAVAARVDVKRAQVITLEDTTTRGQRLSITAQNAAAVAGDVANGTADAGNPVKTGAIAIAHGANPSAVNAAARAALYANRHGIPFTIGGHPNIISAEYFSTAAVTDDNILPAIAGGTKYVITSITVICSNANTVNVSVRIGFGTASVPAQGTTNADAVAKVVLSHPNIAPGSGTVKGNGSGIVGMGGDGEELRITCSVPTGGSLIVQVDYYTIES